jgi:nitrogen fixation protein FixH
MTSQENENAKKSGKPLTGRVVLVWFVSFFSVILGVNMVMLYFAVTTFSGVSTEDAYRKGRDYNQVLQQAREQQALGWVLQTEHVRTSDGAIRLAVEARDGNGDALDGLTIIAVFWRPTQKGLDQTGVLLPSGNGRYSGDFNLPADGNWQILIDARDSNANIYRLTEQAFIKP